MLKKINRVLKLVGLNLVRAKRKKAAKSAGIPYDASKHMGECEWQNIATVPKPGDVACCLEGTENIAFGYVTEAFVGNPNAAFVPVDIGANGHEMTRVEHWETSGGTTPEQNEARFEKPRVEQPTSDNKITGTSS